MRPRDVVRAWVEAFNRADADALAGLYRTDATNHQVAESPVHGREAIRAMFAAGFAAARVASAEVVDFPALAGV
jgi:uncharacterized protein (TIGR02246 family)